MAREISIRWTQQDTESVFVPVWVSVEKLDRSWSMSAYYIGRGCAASISASYDKYIGFGRWLSGAEEPVEAPLVCSWFERTEIARGRHRFAWLRDHGLRSLVVSVHPSDASIIVESLGTTYRKSEVTVPLLGGLKN